MIATSAAIKLGFTQAFSRWATGLFAALASMAEVFAGVIAMLGAVSWLQGDARTPKVAMLAAVLTMLCARILLALVQGGAIRHSAAWLKGQGSGTTLEEIFSAAPRSLAWFLWTLPIELVATLWKWVGLAMVVFAYGRALGTHHAGGGAALTLALFLTLALPLALGWAALRRATLVISVRRDLGAWAAASQAVAALTARTGAFYAVLFTGLFTGGIAEAVLSVLSSGLSPSNASGFEPMIASQLASGVLLAFAAALFELVILYGFTALDSEDVAPAVAAVAVPVSHTAPPAV